MQHRVLQTPEPNATKPLVTLGIVNYNYARFVSGALDSVQAQTYLNIEIIIADDCSTDDSDTVIRSWINKQAGSRNIRYIRNEENRGISRNCNRILKLARGKYYQVLDADDVLLPEKIALDVEIMEANAAAALVYSDTGVIDEHGCVLPGNYLERIHLDPGDMPTGQVLEPLLFSNFVPNSSVLVRTSCALDVGGYDESLQVQDYHLYLKLAERYPFVYCENLTALYRLHSSSVSNTDQTNAKSVEHTLKLLQRYYDNGSPAFKRFFHQRIFNAVPFLYGNRQENKNYWITQNALLNPGLKSWIYYMSNKVGIPFSFFLGLKTIPYLIKPRQK